MSARCSTGEWNGHVLTIIRQHGKPAFYLDHTSDFCWSDSYDSMTESDEEKPKKKKKVESKVAVRHSKRVYRMK